MDRGTIGVILGAGGLLASIFNSYLDYQSGQGHLQEDIVATNTALAIERARGDDLAAGIATVTEKANEARTQSGMDRTFIFDRLETVLDNDGFVYSKDSCEDIAGIDNENDEFDGCPANASLDSDKDSVADIRDACPSTPGDYADSVVNSGNDSGWRSEIFVGKTDGCTGNQIAATCASWLASSVTADDGRTGTVVSNSCKGSDDPTRTWSFDWRMDDKGVVTYDTPSEWTPPPATPATPTIPAPPVAPTATTIQPPPPPAG